MNIDELNYISNRNTKEDCHFTYNHHNKTLLIDGNGKMDDYDENKLSIYERDKCLKFEKKLDRLSQAFVYVDGSIVESKMFINKSWKHLDKITTGILLFFSIENGTWIYCECKKTEIEKAKEVIEILSRESIYNIQLQ